MTRQLVLTDRALRRLGHPRQRIAIQTVVGDRVRDDQVMLGIHRHLHVVAHDPALAVLHRAGIRIGQCYLLVLFVDQNVYSGLAVEAGHRQNRTCTS